MEPLEIFFTTLLVLMSILIGAVAVLVVLRLYKGQA